MKINFWNVTGTILGAYMTLLVPMALIGCTASHGTSIATEHQQRKQDEDKFMASLNPGDCFRDEWTHEAQHSFEKTRIMIDNVHYILAKDDKGLLIAQPHPECHEPSDQSAKCIYWFRSVEYSSPFLVSPYSKKVTCPAGITRESMLERLKKSHEAADYKLESL